MDKRLLFLSGLLVIGLLLLISKPNDDLVRNDKGVVKVEKQEEVKKEIVIGKDQKVVALTFDDGPHATYTPKVLDILKKHNAKATFFLVGNRVGYYPDVVKRAHKEGHEIGNHSWEHRNLSKASDDIVIADIKKTQEKIKSVIGVSPVQLRPPYGAYKPNLTKITNMSIALWNIDTLDWKVKNKNAIVHNSLENIRDESIILMHDIHPTTIEALPTVLEELKKRGFIMVTVSDLNKIIEARATEAAKETK